MTFAFGTRSTSNLRMAEPHLMACCKAAIAISTVDFGVPEKCWRTLAEEQQKVAQGLSHTLKSKHIIQADGYSHAVDLVPFIDGAFTWGVTQAFYEIAEAMRAASVQTGTPLVWGGVWDKNLADLPAGAEALSHAHAAYMQAFHVQHGRYPFVDLPHAQLAS